MAQTNKNQKNKVPETEEVKSLLAKVERVTQQKQMDLSANEDLSIAIMNLISIEEHLFFTSQKTGKSQYLDLLNEVRLMRAELLRQIIKEYEGEVWCISKHLLAASMRVMEVGTKELKKGNKKEAWSLFQKAYQLYSLFWGLNLNVIKMDPVKSSQTKSFDFRSENSNQKTSVSLLSKLGTIVQKAVDCCRE